MPFIPYIRGSARKHSRETLVTMKNLVSIVLTFFSLGLSAQIPEGGQNLEMKAKKVKSVQEYNSTSHTMRVYAS